MIGGHEVYANERTKSRTAHQAASCTSTLPVSRSSVRNGRERKKKPPRARMRHRHDKPGERKHVVVPERRGVINAEIYRDVKRHRFHPGLHAPPHKRPQPEIRQQPSGYAPSYPGYSHIQALFQCREEIHTLTVAFGSRPLKSRALREKYGIIKPHQSLSSVYHAFHGNKTRRRPGSRKNFDQKRGGRGV